MKKIIALVIIVLCAWLIATYPYRMLNPGELVKGHQDLKDKCYSCHKPFWGIETQKCIACHKLSDIGKDTATSNDTIGKRKKILFHQNLKNQKCTLCHTDHKGVNPDFSLRGFDHNLLPGTESGNCRNCHTKPADKIHKQLSGSCINCHKTNGWKSGAVFNHDMIEGVDKNNCVSCHPAPRDNIHKQLSGACINCHNTRGWKSGGVFNHEMIPAADRNNCISCHHLPEASYHKSFKDNCTKCHTTNQWKPSTFNHSAYFQLDEHHNASCNTCHKSDNYSVYTCYGCHEHSERDIISEHSEHGMYNISNCISCHKSGYEHESGEYNSHSEKEHDGGSEDDD